jgi:hypothetical protein
VLTTSIGFRLHRMKLVRLHLFSGEGRKLSSSYYKEIDGGESPSGAQ